MIATRLPATLVLGSALAFAACGGEGLTLPPEGEAAHITVMDGNGQSGRVGSVLAESLVVQVRDTRDRPVAGANVVFSFNGDPAGGEVSPATTTTDSDGRAASSLRLGSRAGPLTGLAEVPVEAGITPVQAPFTATALSGTANGIAAVSGNDQTAPINTALPAPLVIAVTDGSGNPIAGVTVTWTAEGGGSVSEVSTVTGANGQASVTRTLGPTAGQQATLATADGLAGSPVTFTHTATAGSAATVVKVSGDEQSALAGTELANPLVVQVLDQQQNPIPGRAVTWIATGGGGSPNPQNTTTDAQGSASTRWTLGPAAGPNSINAVVSGVSTVSFTAMGTAGEPSASNSAVSASPGSINVGGQSTITVTVRDGTNNPVSGVSVSVASSGSGNTINPASASTGSNGVATFTFSSTVAEPKTITATAGGVTIEDQASITVQKVGSTVEITSDEPDPSTVNEVVTVEFTVAGNGGPPTGDVTVTVSGGPETCTGTLSSGSGSCDILLIVPGTGTNNRRILTATYGGDTRFSGDTDNENHRVNPLPTPNQAPTATFTPPSCIVGQPCQFNDESTDSDGSVESRSWEFPDGNPPTSTESNPQITFVSSGTKMVKLTVTDDDGAPSSVTRGVTVSEPAPVNTPPNAVDDAYTTPGGGPALAVPAETGVLDNDTDDDGDPLTAENASDPEQGTVLLSQDGSFTYTPDPGASGTDTFTYEASDGSDTSQATVTITITTP